MQPDRPPPAPLVVVVDDEAAVRDSLDSLLRSAGLRTLLYASPAELLQHPPPDEAGCLVLDVRLPGIGGLDFQAQLADHGIALPIVFMTGHGDIPMTVRAMKAGAVDFLAKPFRDQDMLDAIDAAVARDRARRYGTIFVAGQSARATASATATQRSTQAMSTRSGVSSGTW